MDEGYKEWTDEILRDLECKGKKEGAIQYIISVISNDLLNNKELFNFPKQTQNFIDCVLIKIIYIISNMNKRDWIEMNNTLTEFFKTMIRFCINSLNEQ